MKKEKDILATAVPLLIEWYQNNRRPMPWRNQPTPYHVWISEIMLQQTRIEAVIPYYERFIKAFGSVELLAVAPDDQLMKLWEGLGYYNRARNLKKAAQMMVLHYNGELPKQVSELKKLPGIGDYTAGAIASIAYGQAEPAVDGNVLRVIMRLTACSKDIMQIRTRTETAAALREVYPSGQEAALLTEALMELGEVICIPHATPKCQDCPLSAHCHAYCSGRTNEFPVRSAKKNRKTQQRTVLLCSYQGKYAIRRRSMKGLLAGMWEFPNVEGNLSETQVAQLLSEWGMTVNSCQHCGEAKHIFTHVEWHMQGYLVECGSASDCFLWKTAEEIRQQYAVPTAFRQYVKLI